MPGRVFNASPAMFPNMRPDRSLLVLYGYPPLSERDTRSMNTMWAWDPWPRQPVDVDNGLDDGMWPDYTIVSWLEEVTWAGGGDRVYRIQGTCKDAAGAVVANATLKLYRTSDDVLVATCTSNSDGFYAFGVEDTTTQYYIVAYRPSPAIEGTTVNTLVGSA